MSSVTDASTTYDHEKPAMHYESRRPTAPVMERQLPYGFATAHHVEPEGEEEKQWKPTKRVFSILATLFIISVIVALDATILVPALPTIADKLNGSANEMFWAGTAYLLTSSTSQPLIAALSDVFGRRGMLLVSLGFFTAGTIIIVLSHNFTVLLTGRSIQGIGGGGILTLNLVLLTDIVPLRQRPIYTAPTQLGWALGTIVGPLLGGLIAKYADWRWIFYLNFPFCLVGFVMIWFCVRLPPKPLSARDIWYRVDWVGGLLFLGSTTSFLVGLTWAGQAYPWVSVPTLVPMGIGALGIFATGVWEWRYARVPFIRRSFLKSWSTMGAYFCAMVQGLMLYAGLYYLSIWLLSVMDKDTVQTGICLLPISCGLLPSAIVSGLLITKLGRYRWSMWFGWCASTLGAGLLYLLNSKSPPGEWVPIFIILGIAHGCLLTGHNFAVQASVDQSEISQATGMFSFFRSFGLCLGVAIPQAVFLDRLMVETERRGYSTAVLQNTKSIINVLTNTPRDSQAWAIIVEIATDAFHFTFLVFMGISAGTLLVSLCLPKHSLDRAFPHSVPPGVRRRLSKRGLPPTPTPSRNMMRSPTLFSPNVYSPPVTVPPPTRYTSMDSMSAKSRSQDDGSDGDFVSINDALRESHGREVNEATPEPVYPHPSGQGRWAAAADVERGAWPSSSRHTEQRTPMQPRVSPNFSRNNSARGSPRRMSPQTSSHGAKSTSRSPPLDKYHTPEW